MSPEPIETPDDAKRLRMLIAEGEKLVESACEVLQQLLDEARAGNAGLGKAVASSQSELTRVLRQARDTERSYHDWRSRTSGEEEVEIDFDSLRDKVRKRLDLLREKIGSRGVPEPPE